MVCFDEVCPGVGELQWVALWIFARMQKRDRKKTETPGSPKQSAENIKKSGPVTSSYWFHCIHAQLVRYLRLLARCCELEAFHSLAVRVQQPHRS